MHSNENNLNELPTGGKGCVPRSGGLDQAHALSPSLPQGHRADALHRSHPGDGDTAAHATESLARNPLEPTAMPTESLGQPRLATESPANRTPQTGNQAGGEGGRGLRSGAGLSRPAPEALPLDNRHILAREEQAGYVAAHLYLYRRDAKLIRENSCKSLCPGVLADEHRKQVGGGKRKKCTDFTLKAQCRLKWWLRNSSIGESVASYAVLTYPLEWPEQWGDWKRHMKLIGQHLRRKGVKGWWGLEFQKRGAPHFNLLLTAGVDRDWLMTTWKAGKELVTRRQLDQSLPLEQFLARLRVKPIYRVPGTAVFMARNRLTVPEVLLSSDRDGVRTLTLNRPERKNALDAVRGRDGAMIRLSCRLEDGRVAMTIEDSWGGDIITAAIAHLAHSTPTEFLFTSTDFNSYVSKSIAAGAPQRVNGRMAASTAPGLGIAPRMEVLGQPVLDLR